MDVAQYHLEKMLPELKELMDKKAFTQEQTIKIIEMRKKYEYRIHRRICLESDFDQYIMYEKQLESKRAMAISDTYKITKCDRSINKRIIALYSKLCYRFPTLENQMAFIDWLIVSKMTNQASQQLLKAIQMFPSSPIPYLKSAEFEMFTKQNHMGAKSILLRGIRHLNTNKDVFIGFIKLESSFLQKTIKRKQLFEDGKFEFEEDKSKDMEENSQVEDYCSVFYIIYKQSKELKEHDFISVISCMFSIFNDLRNDIKAIDSIQDKIKQESIDLLGKIKFMSLLIESNFNGSDGSFTTCATAYQDAIEKDSDLFEPFQMWLLNVKSHLAQKYLMELAKSEFECLQPVYEYCASLKDRDSLSKLNIESPKDILKSDLNWNRKLVLFKQFSTISIDDITSIVQKYIDQGFKDGELLFELICPRLTTDEEVVRFIEYPGLRQIDIDMLTLQMCDCSSAMALYLYKMYQNNKNENIWQHLSFLFKPHRKLYMKAMKTLNK